MKHTSKFRSLAATLFTIGSLVGGANGATITFNGTAGDGGFTLMPGSYNESGFTVTNNSGTNYFLDNDYNNLPLNPWDDDVLEFDSLSTSQVTITLSGGGIFDFNSAYLGSINSSATLTFEGFINGGGSVLQTVLLGLDTRALFNFSGFDNLISLEVSAPTDGAYAIMDDFSFSESAAIPESSSALLFGLAALGFSARRRR